VRVRASKHCPVQHARGMEVCGEWRGAADPLRSIHAGHGCPHDREGLRGRPDREVVTLDDDIPLLDPAFKLNLLLDDSRHLLPPGLGYLYRRPGAVSAARATSSAASWIRKYAPQRQTLPSSARRIS